MADAINDLDDFLDNVDENGVHLCQVAGIRTQQSTKDNRNWVIFKFTVSDTDSPLEGEDYELWVQDFSHLSTEDYNALPGKQKSSVRTAKRRLKETYLSLGFNEDEANELRSNPKSEVRNMVKGNEVWVKVSVTENNGREYKNVQGIRLRVEDDGNPDNPPF